MKKIINIFWEITLNCNLNCIFCISWWRRNFTKWKISFEEAIKIINNLPQKCHISFIWWEPFVFPRFIEILKYLDNIWITYEITTNWTLIKNQINKLNKLKNLTNIYFSIDLYWNRHDLNRWYKWLFNNIIEIIPKINTIINVNTIILPKTNLNEVIMIFYILEKLNVNNHRISYYMNFSKNDIKKTKYKINNLKISTKFIEKIDNINLKQKTIKIYKSLVFIKEKNNFKINIDFHPISILKWWPTKCKSMFNYYRINEYWKLSTCHFIDNDFDNLIENKFEDVIKNKNYLEIKNNIINNYPLEICLTCWKWT